MKHPWLVGGGAAVLALLFSNQAYAQSVAVELNPAQRSQIKDYIVKQKVAPAPVKESFLLGSKVPTEVDLRSVPGSWGPTVSRYNYIYADNRVYFVEPSSRRIVRIVE